MKLFVLLSTLVALFSLCENLVTNDSPIQDVIQRLKSARNVLSLAHERHLKPMEGLLQEAESLTDTSSGADVTLLSDRFTHSLLVAKVEFKMTIKALFQVVEWMAERIQSMPCVAEAEKNLKEGIADVVRLETLTRESLELYENEKSSLGIESKEHLKQSVKVFVQKMGTESEKMIDRVEESVYNLSRCDDV